MLPTCGVDGCVKSCPVGPSLPVAQGRWQPPTYSDNSPKADWCPRARDAGVVGGEPFATRGSLGTPAWAFWTF